eukprot:962016_1
MYLNNNNSDPLRCLRAAQFSTKKNCLHNILLRVMFFTICDTTTENVINIHCIVIVIIIKNVIVATSLSVFAIVYIASSGMHNAFASVSSKLQSDPYPTHGSHR